MKGNKTELERLEGAKRQIERAVLKLNQVVEVLNSAGLYKDAHDIVSRGIVPLKEAQLHLALFRRKSRRDRANADS